MNDVRIGNGVVFCPPLIDIEYAYNDSMPKVINDSSDSKDGTEEKRSQKSINNYDHTYKK